MTTEEIAYYSSIRTLTPAEVDARGREKDKLSLTPAERLEQFSHAPEPQSSRH